MKVIKPYYQILSNIDSKTMYQLVERAARTCYKSEGRITEDSAERMINLLIEAGHEAMLEFADIHVLFVCDRGISHELVRHRIASFAQESTRYCNYSKNELVFIEPSWLSDNKVTKQIWEFAMEDVEDYYLNLMENGWTPQMARTVLPNSIKTEINMKANIREWRHFLKLRTSKRAHPQMRELTIPLLKELQGKLPIFFNDIKAEL